MEITTTFAPETRAAWRAWLAENHATAREIWVLHRGGEPPEGAPTYLDLVEEALCFGWIDGIAKKAPDDPRSRTAQRFTPRRPRGNWTELNKERARRLIAAGLMTEAGRRVLPDLDPSGFRIPPDIEAALAEAGALETFLGFPPVYQRIRVGYVDEQRKQREEFARRLASLVSKTAAGQMFGNWDDTALPRTPGPGGPVGS
jgi:uncharacterized protein YdeI (YjbR/CyaY-like superfamily)